MRKFSIVVTFMILIEMDLIVTEIITEKSVCPALMNSLITNQSEAPVSSGMRKRVGRSELACDQIRKKVGGDSVI